jgi:hypothetical protein
MAEVFGAVAAGVGVLSTIVTLFEACSKGYARFTHARDFEKTYATLFMKLRIQEARLHIWGRRWGIQDGKLVEEVEASEVLRRIVQDVLQQMDQLLQDSVQLSTKYGIHETFEVSSKAEGTVSNGAPGSGSETVSQNPLPSDTDIKGGSNANGFFSTPHALTNIKRKTRWAISAKDKFDLLVSELRYFNDSLYDVLPLPVRQYLQQAALPSEILRTDDRSKLRAIFDAASPNYDILTQAANIRNLNITDGNSSSFIGNVSSAMLKITKAEIDFESAGNSATKTAKRVLAFYTSTVTGSSGPPGRRRVLIEWRAFEKNVNEEFAHVLYSRVENLARLLHPATRKPSSYGALDCVGFYPDYLHSRYGFVYSLPRVETTPITLQQLLVKSSSNPHPIRPHLGARFALARRIARALLQLHTSGWLHKGLCSQNILFFMSESSSGNTAAGVDFPDEESLQAWITGFDYARPDDFRELTDKRAPDTETDIYRHRLVLEGIVRYRRTFDIYSLGLILLEIGLWTPLKDIYKAKYTYETFKLRLEQFHYPALAFAAGKTYESVVRRCLDDGLNDKTQGLSFEDSEISTQDGFCWDIVKGLEKCTA